MSKKIILHYNNAQKLLTNYKNKKLSHNYQVTSLK